MLKVRQDDTGYWQGLKMTFINGYTISVQFGEGNYCLNYLIPIEEKRQKDIGQCKNCETAILKPNGKFLKYKGDEVQGYQTADDVAETIAYIQTLQPNNYGRVSKHDK